MSIPMKQTRGKHDLGSRQFANLWTIDMVKPVVSDAVDLSP